MPHRFSRKELYEAVWSEPMRSIAARYSISDVGLSKACRRYNIPVPERGYWAKRKAGKDVSQRSLPFRAPGMSDDVLVGFGNNRWYRQQLSDEEVLKLDLLPPVFDREIDEVIAEVRETVDKVTVPKSMRRPHRLIGKLLDLDEDRRQKAATDRYAYSWNKPLFGSQFEKRRLRLLNAIFMTLERCGMKPCLRGKEARDTGVQVNDQYVSFNVDDANMKLVHHASEYQRPRIPSGRIKVIIHSSHATDGVQPSWEDTKTISVESSITDIVVELVGAGERQYRAGTQRHFEWIVDRKVHILEKDRLRKEEAERVEQERRIQLENERIERLSADAGALNQASNIRIYVQTVEASYTSGGNTVSEREFQIWKKWALSQADRIDPVVSGNFLDSVRDRL